MRDDNPMIICMASIIDREESDKSHELPVQD